MKIQAIGKVLGALGLVLLLSSPFTLFVTSGSATLAGVKAGLGALLVVVYFATHYKRLGQFASGRATFFFVSSAVTTLLLIALLGVGNYLVAKKTRTYDLTNKKIYTLAPQTRSTLGSLKEPVQAYGFIPSNHPAYEALESLFERYRRESGGKFGYAFKDPIKHPDLAAKYSLKEGDATVVLTRASSGAGTGESSTTLNVVSEQELTNALVKINTVGVQKAYFVTGHGEWALDGAPPAGMPADHSPAPPSEAGISELKRALNQEGYSAEALNLAGKSEIPRDASVVVLAGPKSALSEPEVATLRRYLDQGGRMIFFAEMNAEPKLDTLLATYGIQVDPGVVADNQLGIRGPYVIIAPYLSEHAITATLKAQNLLNLQFPTARGLTVLRSGTAPEVKAEPVVLTSQFAWVESTPDDNPQPSSGEKTGQIPVVAATTRTIAEAEGRRYPEARLVVFGDSQLLTDANWGYEPNRNLVLNAMAWASSQAEKISIRPPDRDISTIDLTPDMLARIRFAAVDLLPLTLLGTGLAIWLTRRSK